MAIIIRKETIMAGIYFISCAYFMAIFQVIADRKNPGPINALPDFGFDILPYLPYYNLADIYVHLYLVLVLIYLFFICDHFQTAMRRFLWVMGTLYLLRSFTITFTILPTPFEGCELPLGDSQHRIMSESLFSIAFKIITLRYSTCGDVLYSGHTMTLTLSTLLLHIYSTNILIKISAWIINIIGMLLIIATHFHYSDDVVIAFFLTILSFMIYHWGLWMGRLYISGIKMPLGRIGFLILLLDGTSDNKEKFCSAYCNHNIKTSEITIDSENNHHTIVTPPSIIPNILAKFLHKNTNTHKLNTLYKNNKYIVVDNHHQSIKYNANIPLNFNKDNNKNQENISICI